MSNTPGGDTTLKRLQVVLTGNTRQLQQAMSQAQQVTSQTESRIKGSMDKVGATLKRVGAIAAAALSVKAIVGFGKSCIDLGSDLTEVQNVVDVTFGTMNKQVDKFAKGAIKQFGLSETAAKRYTSTMGSMLKSMGLTTEQAYDMSTTMTGLTGDMASFYNLDAETAFEKIRSGISGETEPLKQLGINMSVANLEAYALAQGITTSYNSMTQAEQAMLRYNYLLDATADAQGDFARTSGGWANQTRILAMQFDSIKASIGQGLIMALTPALKVINSIIAKLSELSEKFKVTMAAITGTDLSTDTSAVTSSLQDSAAAAEDTGAALVDGMDEAADAAKRFLFGFDELHQLGGNDSDIVDQDALDALSDPATVSGMQALNDATAGENSQLSAMQAKLDALKAKMQPVIDMARQMASEFKAGFSAGLGSNFSGRVTGILTDIKSIGQHIKDIFTDPEVVGAAENYLSRVSYAIGQITGSVASVGVSIGSNIVGGIESFLAKSKERIKAYIVSMLDIRGDIAEVLGNLAQSVARIFEPFGGENGQTLTGNIIGIFADAFMAVTELGQKAARDILGVFATPIILNTDALRKAFDDVLAYGASITGTIQTAVDFIGDKANEVYDAHIKPLIDNISLGISDIVGTVMEIWDSQVAPMLDQVSSAVSDLWTQHLQPMFDTLGDALGAVFDTLSILWDFVQPIIDWLVSSVLGTVLPQLHNLLTTTINILGDIADALTGVFSIVEGVINFVVGVFTGDWDRAWRGAEGVVQGFAGIVDGVIGIVKDTIWGLIDSVVDFFSSLGGAIADGIGRLIDWGRGLFGLDTPDPYKSLDNTTAAEAQTMDSLRGSAYYAIQSGQATQDDMYAAMRAALEDTDGGDVNLYIDGEEIATATDKARQLRNTRYNPQLAY